MRRVRYNTRSKNERPTTKPCGRKYGSVVFLRCGLSCLIAVAAGLAGCGIDPGAAAIKTDEKVYAAIDRQWQDDFGGRTDVRIEPDQGRDAHIRAILKTVRQTRTLTLEQAVQLAVLSAPEYRTEVEHMYLTGLDQLDAERLYALIPFAGAGAVYQRYGADETIDYRADAGAQQLLATGATVLTDITVGYVDVLTGDVRSGASSIFRAAVVQPLLRGADRMVVLETLTQAQQNTLYAVRDFNRFRKTFCASVAEDYFRLNELARRTVIAQENGRRLEDLVAKMDNLLAVGRLSRHDVEEAKQDLFKARNDVIEMQKRYHETLDAFKVRLNIPPQTAFEPSPRNWLILPDLLPAETGWTEQSAVEVALGQRLDLANTQDRIADAERKVRIAEDALGADLALFGLAAPASGTARSRYELGLQGNLPVDRVTEMNNYRRAALTLTAQERLYEQQRLQVTAEVRKAWRDMAEARDRYIIQNKARDLAQQRLENTTLLLHYGRANTRDVLDAQEDLYDSDDDYTRALTDLAVAQMNFLRDTETLWILPDGNFEPQVASQ